MARQLKKIQRRVMNRRAAIEKKSASLSRVREPAGKDYFLIFMIAFTVIVLIVGHNTLDVMGIIMYCLMIAALATTYAKRHYPMTDNVYRWVERVSFVCVGSAIGLFCFQLYNEFVGKS